MSKDEKQNKTTSSLRFPQFRESGDWERKTLSDFGDFYRGLTYSAGDVVDDGLLVLRSSNIQKGLLVLDSDLVHVSRDCPEDIRMRRGDLAICMSNGSKKLVGKSGELKQDPTVPTTVGAFCSIFRPRNELAKYLLQTPRYVGFVRTAIGGGNINNLKNSDLESLDLRVPPTPAEQRKIAACLGSLDDWIAAEARRLAALRRHKTGLMQQLFPRPGQTRPRLRFPEFQNAIADTSRTVGKLAQVTTGDKDTQNKVDNGEFPFFVRSQTTERIDSFAYDGEAVLTSGDGVGVGENFHYIVGKFDFHQRVYCIYDFSADLVGRYFFYFFASHFKKRVKRMSAKNSVDSVRRAMITEMPVWLPEPAEQRRIADCLAALDARLSAQSAKLAALRHHKRGLMQGLFPSPTS
jgi:type I restriction enzyme S subunit